MRAVGTGLVLSALFLAACSTAAEPTTLATPTAEPTPTATPAATPTASQTLRSETPEAAAERHLERYLVAANAASRGEGLEEFRSLFTTGCTICMAQYENFTAAYGAGNTAEGTLYEDWAIFTENASEDSALIRTEVSTGIIVLRDTTGGVIDTFDGEENVTTVWTLQADQDGNWIIVGSKDLP